MLFNSWTFPVFLLLVWSLYRALETRGQNILLLIASYVFYGWWDWRFTGLLALSTVVDFTCGLRMKAETTQANKRRYLYLSLATNLGILGFFKYFNFFVGSVRDGLELLGLEANVPLLQVVLPVGISFYTFQTMAYTIDIYRNQEKPTNSFLEFALYVAYFPQLVAGPIERSTVLLPQISAPREVTAHKLRTGFELIVMGFLKKVLIADSVAPFVKDIFSNPAEMGRVELLLGAYLFALQIYGDFAGYTDIARGVSRLFGIELGLNFRQPYLSANITDFWRRWHISLSSWLRDYLYIPLGGSRNGELMTYRNNFITMVLGGLWHGASWNFVVWGALHGIYLAVHKLSLRGKRPEPATIPSSIAEWAGWLPRVFITFNLVCFAWIFFRADTLTLSTTYLSGFATHPMLTSDTRELLKPLLTLAFFGMIMLLIDLGCWKRASEVPVPETWPAWIRGTLYGLAIVSMFLIGESDAQPFIYFQF